MLGIIGIAGLVGVVGLAGGVIGWRAWQLARLLEDTPTSLVRSAAQGYVRLEGEARLMPGEPVVAPLSRRPCVWWRFRIEERDRRNRWHIVEQDTSIAHFELADATGAVLVDPEGADVHGATADVWYGDTPQPVAGPPAVTGFRGFGDRFRYREERIDTGSFLHALGQLGTERAAGGFAHESEVAARLRVWKRDPVRIALFDADRNGQLDATEWEHARAAARAETSREAAASDHSPIAIVRAPQHGRPFVLGALSPERLGRRYRLRAAAGTLVFLAALVVAVHLASRLTSQPTDPVIEPGVPRPA